MGDMQPTIQPTDQAKSSSDRGQQQSESAVAKMGLDVAASREAEQQRLFASSSDEELESRQKAITDTVCRAKGGEGNQQVATNLAQRAIDAAENGCHQLLEAYGRQANLREHEERFYTTCNWLQDQPKELRSRLDQRVDSYVKNMRKTYKYFIRTSNVSAALARMPTLGGTAMSEKKKASATTPIRRTAGKRRHYEAISSKPA